MFSDVDRKVIGEKFNEINACLGDDSNISIATAITELSVSLTESISELTAAVYNISTIVPKK